jgi:hypothetical protein
MAMLHWFDLVGAAPQRRHRLRHDSIDNLGHARNVAGQVDASVSPDAKIVRSARQLSMFLPLLSGGLRSVNSMVIAPACSGKDDNSKKNEVTSSAQTNSGIFKKMRVLLPLT